MRGLNSKVQILRQHKNAHVARLINKGWDWLCRKGTISNLDPYTKQFGYFGEGACLMFPRGTIFGEKWIQVGSKTLIGPYSCISAGMVPGQEMVSDPVVSIGERCLIGRGSHIVGHFRIEVGDDVFTGPYVYITDQNHGYKDPDIPIGLQWPNDQPVKIGSGSWIGTNVTILPGTTLGSNVVVASSSVVNGSFPDRCVIAGAPAKIVREFHQDDGWIKPET